MGNGNSGYRIQAEDGHPIVAVREAVRGMREGALSQETQVLRPDRVRTNLAGNVNGQFFGNVAANTAGRFQVNSTAGAPYSAFGVFGGPRIN